MNLQISTSYQNSSEHTTLILPFNSQEISSFQPPEDVSIPAIGRMLSILENSKNKSIESFNSENGKTIASILWSIKFNNQAALNHSAAEFIKKHGRTISDSLTIDLRLLKNDKHRQLLTTLLRSHLLSLHNVGKLKTEPSCTQHEINSICVVSDSIKQVELDQLFERVKHEAEAIISSMSLVDAPANHKRPQDLARHVVDSGKKYGYKVTVFDKEQLEEKGFKALLAVNRGSEDPAQCIIAEYTGAGSKDTPTVAIVGKGVTFDTGGMSIKPSQNMHYMKSDMGGAAAVIGAIELAARLKIKANIVAVVPCTDNSVDKYAIKPGDVIGSFKGSTIEVIDTDAEGRLILADGLNYAITQYKPDYVVDLATLTGSIVRTLGSHAAGLMTKSDKLAEALIVAGEKSGDRIWQLPLWDDYDQYLVSDVADIRNLSTKPIGGAITAAKFLEHFTDAHANWAHLDIAGTAFGNTTYAKGYSATGFGILLLLSWVENLT